MITRSALVTALLFCAGPAYGQIQTTLRPETAQRFLDYAKKVEAQLEARWDGKQPFESVEQSPADLKKVLAGELLIRPGSPQNPISIPNGLIHDWLGDVFIPNVSMEKVLAILQDFDRHQKIYPEIVRSTLLKRDGENFTGYWRLRQKNSLLPVALDVVQEAHYKQIGPGKWICRAYANDISEIDNPGSSKEKKQAPGKGQGLLWRMYAYWTLEVKNGGILAECRSLSLSRDIPFGLSWAIKPFIQSVPRESLESTLRNTRSAASK